MKALKIVSGIMLVIGFLLIMGVVGADDYYLEMGIPHASNIVMAMVGIGLILQAPFILNLPERKSEWQKKNNLKLK